MKKLTLLILLPFISLAQSTLITAGSSGNVSLPNLTYPQIMAIPSPQAGMEAFDTDYGCVRIYNGSSWRCHDTPQNQPNVLTTAVKADAATTVFDTFSDVFSTGPVIAAGNFQNSITFGSTTLTSAGGQDIFLVKYDINGAVAWAKRIGGAAGGLFVGDEAVTDVIAESGSQNFYITGRIGSSSITGAMTATTVNATDGFIAKFDANGNLLWSNTFTGTVGVGYDGLSAISVIGNDVYVCGYQSGGGTLGGTPLSATNSQFTAKYNGLTGAVLWVYELSGAAILDIAANSTRVVIAGEFSSPTITLGGITYNNNGSGSSDAFVVCLDNLGTFQWANTFGSNSFDTARTIALANNKVIIGGGINANLLWGNTQLNNIGSFQMYLAQYDLMGNKELIKGLYGGGGANIKAIESDLLGNIYIMGSCGNRLWFENQFVSNATSSNVFVAKLSLSRDCMWARLYNTNTSSGGSISIVLNNTLAKIYVSGYFNGTSRFGHTLLTTPSLNMFLATITEN